MKKLFKLIIVLLFLYGCGASGYKEDAIDSTFVADSTMLAEPLETISVAKMDAFQMKAPDTVIRKKQSSLDTTKVVKNIRKNLEVIDQQQKTLDSLLKK
jgi:uncharacterized protein YcfL